MNIQEIQAALQAVAIPHTQRTLGSENAVKSVNHDSDGLHITLQFGYPVLHIGNELANRIQEAIIGFTGDTGIHLNIDTVIGTHKVQPGVSTIKGVKNIIAVGSGKGGVGKSTTTANLATAMARMGARVGVLDADLYGPSQPTMLGVSAGKPDTKNEKLVPVTTESGIQVMSIGFLMDTDQAVIWRGPLLSQALQQLLFQSEWDDVDYLFIDLPPGTGDIQLTLSQKIPVTGAVVVTTPQDIALIDARKAVDMFKKSEHSNLRRFGKHVGTHLLQLRPQRSHFRYCRRQRLGRPSECAVARTAAAQPAGARSNGQRPSCRVIGKPRRSGKNLHRRCVPTGFICCR